MTETRPKVRDQELPPGLGAELRHLRATEREEFLALLHATLNVGWTQSSIGRALGVTRRAVNFLAKQADQPAMRVAARRVGVPHPPQFRAVTPEEATELRALHAEATTARGRGPKRLAAERLAVRLHAIHSRGIPLTSLAELIGVSDSSLHYRLAKYGHKAAPPWMQAAGRVAAANPSQERGRWTCPGRHCGSYQGYKYGCREPACESAVAPHSAARRVGAGVEQRTPIDQTVQAQILDAVRDGTSLIAACEAAGISLYRLANVRRADPAFDTALIAAAEAGGLTPPLRPIRRPRCPGDDCGTLEGYRLGCRQDPCGQEHSAALTRAPSRQRSTSGQRRFGTTDREAVLGHLRAGHTVVEAAKRAGWSYDALSNARKNDASFDAAVIAARAEGRLPGTPGDRVREVSRIDGM